MLACLLISLKEPSTHASTNVSPPPLPPEAVGCQRSEVAQISTCSSAGKLLASLHVSDALPCVCTGYTATSCMHGQSGANGPGLRLRSVDSYAY
eukprot:6172746-Pleurochrysis_carterae.AAC.2